MWEQHCVNAETAWGWERGAATEDALPPGEDLCFNVHSSIVKGENTPRQRMTQKANLLSNPIPEQADGKMSVMTLKHFKKYQSLALARIAVALKRSVWHKTVGGVDKRRDAVKEQ